MDRKALERFPIFSVSIYDKTSFELFFVVSNSTGWCESRGTVDVLLLRSVKTEMTETIEIGLKLLTQHLHNKKYRVL